MHLLYLLPSQIKGGVKEDFKTWVSSSHHVVSFSFVCILSNISSSVGETMVSLGK